MPFFVPIEDTDGVVPGNPNPPVGVVDALETLKLTLDVFNLYAVIGVPEPAM
jgi:hypothetical protein